MASPKTPRTEASFSRPPPMATPPTINLRVPDYTANTLFNPAQQYNPENASMLGAYGGKRRNRSHTGTIYDPGFHGIMKQSFGSLTSEPILAHGLPFVQMVVLAFEHGVQLTIRPDDVWLAIVYQVGRMLKGSWKLRSNYLTEWDADRYMMFRFGERASYRNDNSSTMFATEPNLDDFGNIDDKSHDQHPISDLRLPGNSSIFNVNTKEVEEALLNEVGINFASKQFEDWATLDFTTSTNADRIAGEIGLFGTGGPMVKARLAARTSLPVKIVQLGTRADWIKILRRVKKMTQFDYKFGEWNSLLESIVYRLADTFNQPNVEKYKTFWKAAYHPITNSKTKQVELVAGWITAFNYWDERGHRIHHFSTHNLPNVAGLSNTPEVYNASWVDRAIPAHAMPDEVIGMPVVVVQDNPDGHQHLIAVAGCHGGLRRGGNRGSVELGDTKIVGHSTTGWWLLKVSINPLDRRSQF